jgi:hypothetical protein
MIVMPANQSGPRVHYMAGRYPGRMGWLVGPSARKKTKLRKWIPYALDNDAFSAWTNNTPWSVEEWRALLDWSQASGFQAMWALCPDVVTNREETIARWHQFSPELFARKIPAAFAVQDGMTASDVPPNADVVFVGGSTEFKWSTLEMWASNFPRVHVGRVNSAHRLFECFNLGVESVDGTGWMRDESRTDKMDALEDFICTTQTCDMVLA